MHRCLYIGLGALTIDSESFRSIVPCRAIPVRWHHGKLYLPLRSPSSRKVRHWDHRAKSRYLNPFYNKLNWNFFLPKLQGQMLAQTLTLSRNKREFALTLEPIILSGRQPTLHTCDKIESSSTIKEMASCLNWYTKVRPTRWDLCIYG